MESSALAVYLAPLWHIYLVNAFLNKIKENSNFKIDITKNTTAKIGTDISDIIDINGISIGRNFPVLKITGLKRKVTFIYARIGGYHAFYSANNDYMHWQSPHEVIKFPLKIGTKAYVDDTSFSIPIAAAGEAGSTIHELYYI